MVCYWSHSVAEVLGSLIRAGLRIETFEEYPFLSWRLYPWMERHGPSDWRLPAGGGDIPLMFSLRAVKDTR